MIDLPAHFALKFTPLFAALLGLIYMRLTLAVPRLRIKYKVGIGDGGHDDLARAIRVHANFAEHVPLTLLLLLMVELQGFSDWILVTLGFALVAARAGHAYGLSRSSGRSPGRFWGTVVTLLVLLAAIILTGLSAFGIRV